MRRHSTSFAALAPVVTLENEFVDAGVLEALERRGARVLPAPACVRVVQDKFLQKTGAGQRRVAGAAFRAVDDPRIWTRAPSWAGR